MIIEAKGLAKRLGRHDAVQGLNLSVPRGAAMALIGANGAGKTTTLRLLLNILRPDAGTATVLGMDSRRLRAADFNRIGYVSESQTLPAGLTVAQFFDYLRPLYPAWDQGLEADLRRRMDLPADRKISGLSHGMRMKTALVSALPFRPEVLILDEPLSGLDPLVRDEVMDGLLGQAGEMTILISSHELAEIEGFATHVAFMDAGRVTLSATADDLAARFRRVSVTLRDPAAPTRSAPATWLALQVEGRRAVFVDSDHAGPQALAGDITAHFGAAAQIDAAPMSLRDISKTLIRASRKEPV